MLNSGLIEMYKDPYGEGFDICLKDSIEFKEGLTVLVGCNGAGKSTMIATIKEELKKAGNGFAELDCVREHSMHTFMDAKAFEEDYRAVANIALSSEGEGRKIVFGNWLSTLHEFIVEGEINNSAQRLLDMCVDKDEVSERKKKRKAAKDRWILVDAVDSGLSIDSTAEIKDVINLIIQDGSVNDKTVRIVLSTNDYEFAADSNCLDVVSGEYCTFDSYEDYRTFILKSRQAKDKRIEKWLNSRKRSCGH